MGAQAPGCQKCGRASFGVEEARPRRWRPKDYGMAVLSRAEISAGPPRRHWLAPLRDWETVEPSEVVTMQLTTRSPEDQEPSVGVK